MYPFIYLFIITPSRLHYTLLSLKTLAMYLRFLFEQFSHIGRSTSRCIFNKLTFLYTVNIFWFSPGINLPYNKTSGHLSYRRATTFSHPKLLKHVPRSSEYLYLPRIRILRIPAGGASLFVSGLANLFARLCIRSYRRVVLVVNG